jgi:hypothetical protein
MSEDKNDWWKQLLKALGITIAVLLLLVVVAFGLLVGFCALGSRH